MKIDAIMTWMSTNFETVLFLAALIVLVLFMGFSVWRILRDDSIKRM